MNKLKNYTGLIFSLAFLILLSPYPKANSFDWTYPYSSNLNIFNNTFISNIFFMNSSEYPYWKALSHTKNSNDCQYLNGNTIMGLPNPDYVPKSKRNCDGFITEAINNPSINTINFSKNYFENDTSFEEKEIMEKEYYVEAISTYELLTGNLSAIIYVINIGVILLVLTLVYYRNIIGSVIINSLLFVLRFLRIFHNKV